MMANSITGMILAVHILALRFAAALAGMVLSGSLSYRCICIAAIMFRRRRRATVLAKAWMASQRKSEGCCQSARETGTDAAGCSDEQSSLPSPISLGLGVD